MYKIRYVFLFGFWRGLLMITELYVKKTGVAKITLPKYPHPIFLRRNSSDIKVFEQIFIYREYAVSVPHPVQFIIDGGANIGLAAIYLQQQFPQATIVCVEPEPENFGMLKKNVQAYSQIHCLQNGLWNQKAFLQIADEFAMGSWGFICKEVDSPNPQTIEAISIDDVLHKFERTDIDILKLDIEGAEYEVFADHYQNWLPNTKVIMIELHDWFRKGCSKSFFSALLQYNFSVMTKGENIICLNDSNQ